MPDVRSEYPLSRILFAHRDLVLWYEAAYVLFYYIAWEFFFRGFLLFPLAKRFGGMNAVLIQTISSCLVHIGKPEAEIFGSIFAGIIFGVLALRTRSFWYGFALHAGIGVLTDLFILFFPR
jgi:membrane protease YdiL (CAAX protease family)